MIRRFVLTVLLAVGLTLVMFVGQTLGEWLRESPDLARVVMGVLALGCAVAWERLTRPDEG